jgi:hypothetical protein
MVIGGGGNWDGGGDYDEDTHWAAVKPTGGLLRETLLAMTYPLDGRPLVHGSLSHMSVSLSQK